MKQLSGGGTALSNRERSGSEMKREASTGKRSGQGGLVRRAKRSHLVHGRSHRESSSNRGQRRRGTVPTPTRRRLYHAELWMRALAWVVPPGRGATAPAVWVGLQGSTAAKCARGRGMRINEAGAARRRGRAVHTGHAVGRAGRGATSACDGMMGRVGWAHCWLLSQLLMLLLLLQWLLQ